MELDRGILFCQAKDGEGRPCIGGLRHPGQELRETGVGQRGNLLRQHRFQRHTSAVYFVILPGKLMRAMACERAAVF